jgi:hypothetical protein
MFQTFFYLPKVHSLNNFLKDEMFISFLGRAWFHFYETLKRYVCLKVFMKNILNKIDMMLNKIMQ